LRPSDYATWGLSTIGMPGLFTILEYFDPQNGRTFTKPSSSVLRFSSLLGFCCGFFIVYNKSTKRFWGITENQREIQKDRYEMKKKISKFEPLFPKSSMTPWLQSIAHRNSQNSQIALFILPWFNLANHQNHGVDISKYYEIRKGEESWEFNNLPKLEEYLKIANAKLISGEESTLN